MNWRAFMLRAFALLLACGFSLYAPVIMAQEEPQQENPPVDESKPKPAARSTLPVIGGEDENQNQNDMEADFTPLTGLQNPSLGTAPFRHSYIVPGLQYGLVAGSSPNGTGSSSWFTQNYFLGNVSLLKAWSWSRLSVNYSAGGYVSTGDNQGSVGGSGSGWSQQLALTQVFQRRRWLFQILDQFSYLPTSQFGFGGGTNLGVPGIGGSLGVSTPGIGGSFVPNQSIFATSGPIYSNVGALQATYTISRRGSITIAGDYGILRFSEPGNVDSDTVLGSVGYNYSLTHKDTIGVVYQFSSYHYQGVSQALGNHYVNVAYSRKITGRLALQLFGGPQISTYRIPVGGSSEQTGFDASAYLNYGTRNGGIAAGYTRGLSGGSGVLVGSNLNQFTFTGNRRLGRIWRGNVNLGYAHNTSLAGAGQSSTNYDSFYGGAGVNRSLGRNANMGLSYAAYFSSTGLSNCTGPNCNVSTTTHTINLSLQWFTRPYVLE
jgi:hypothetical protein